MTATITGTALLNKVATALYDVNNLKWSRAELLGWLNDGQRQVMMIAPGLNDTEVAMPLVAGTRQTVPQDGWGLIDVHYNLAADGVTPGRAIRLVERKILDQFNPNWRTITPGPVVQNYMFDPADNRAFWVSPPSDGTGFAWVHYAQTPVDLAVEADVLSMSDIFEPILLDYIMYRAYRKAAPFAPDPQTAASHWSAFAAALATLTGSEQSIDPNQALEGPAPPQGAAP